MATRRNRMLKRGRKSRKMSRKMLKKVLSEVEAAIKIQKAWKNAHAKKN